MSSPGVIFFDQIGAIICGGLHITLVPSKDWLLLSQVFEGPHFKKAAMPSKKLSFAQPSWTAQADPADPSMGATSSFFRLRAETPVLPSKKP
jgi:hypothetical protein